MSTSQASDRYPLLLVAGGASLISTAAPLVRMAQAADVSPTAAAAWRGLLGALALFALVLVRGAPLLPPRAVWGPALLAGLAFAADLYVWHQSIVTIGAGLATVVANTQVFWTALFGRFVYREHLSRLFWPLVALAFAGVLLVALSQGQSLGQTIAFGPGVGLAALTGVFYAAYILLVRHSNRLVGDTSWSQQPASARLLTTLAWVSLTTGSALALASLTEPAPLIPLQAHAWWWLSALALVPQVLGWLVITAGLRRAKAAPAALMFLLQPALATVWGLLFLGESLSAAQLTGVALTLGAVGLGALLK